MTLRRRRALAEPALRAARQLKRCESAIALLDRVRPLNLAAERARLATACAAGRRPAPELRYAPGAELEDVKRALGAACAPLDQREPEQRVLAARAAELELEAALCEQVASPGFGALAARRFPLPKDDAALRRRARELLAEPQSAPSSEALHESDDASDPHSLLSVLTRRVFAERLPARVEVDPGLVALAAVADGVVKVRAGARLSAEVARRVALHEVDGHLAPRVSGQALGGVFLAASPGASQDEEGRAILLEERAGLLGAQRRAELSRRYLAAASVRDGADFWQTVELLRETGADPFSAVELGCRVHRGGGLGRELLYLAGYLQVRETLDREPELEALLRAGRVSLAAARELLPSVELDDDRNVI